MDFIKLMLIKSVVLSVFGLILILGDGVFKKIKAGTRCYIWWILLFAMVLPVGLIKVEVPTNSPIAGMVKADTREAAGDSGNEVDAGGQRDMVQTVEAQDTYLPGTDLSGADFRDTDIQDTDLQDTHSQIQQDVSIGKYIKYIFIAVWAVGVLAFLVFHFVCFGIIVFKCRNCRKAQYGGITCFISEQAVTPFTMGIFRKKIILPDREYPDEYLKMILSHETLHIKRHDIEGKVIALSVNALIWFNPVVWLMRGRYNRDIELACDEKLTENMGEVEKIKYGELLYSEAKKNINFAYGTFFVRKEELKGRIENILYTADRKKGYVLFGIAAVVGIIFIFNITVKDENDNSDNVHQEENIMENGTDYDTTTEPETEEVTENITENVTEPEIIVSDFGYQYYTGYLDECIEYRSYNDFVDKDYDGDGLTDRVYRESKTLNCRYRVEFGNGIVLDIDKWNPTGTILRLESADLDNDGEQELVFVNKCDSYTSNNSYPTIDIMVYDKDGSSYKEMALPFKTSENSAPKVTLDYEYQGEHTYNVYVAGYDIPFSYKIPDSDWVYGEYAYMSDPALPTNYQGIADAYIKRDSDGDKLAVSFKALKKGAMGRITLILGYDNGLIIEQGVISE
ncbi:MAG: M56 family metallopeptidase [Lachnospiraceae bacterium]